MSKKTIKEGASVVVRDDMSGVWCGSLVKHSAKKKTATLTDARRAHYWEQGGCCSGLATYGPAGDKSRISPAVSEVSLCSVVEVLTCTDDAAQVWREFAEWPKR